MACFSIDPHGTLAEECLALVPPAAAQPGVLLRSRRQPSIRSPSIIFADVHPDDREFLAEGIVSAMYTIWGDSWGPQLERILRNSLIVLLDSPGTSFLHIPRFLTDPEFRDARREARQESGGARVLRRTSSRAGRRISSRPRSRRSSTRSRHSPSIRRSAMCLGQERSKLHFEHALQSRPHRHRETCERIGRRQAGVPHGFASPRPCTGRHHGA